VNPNEATALTDIILCHVKGGFVYIPCSFLLNRRNVCISAVLNAFFEGV
jgi:hypothetical protein